MKTLESLKGKEVKNAVAVKGGKDEFKGKVWLTKSEATSK